MYLDFIRESTIAQSHLAYLGLKIRYTKVRKPKSKVNNPMQEPTSPLQVDLGKILIYHLYDVADAIDLERLRTDWAGRASNIKLVSRRSSPYYLQFEREPLLLPLGQRSLVLKNERWLDAEVRAKVFDFGVVSLSWEIPFPAAWSEVVNEADLYIDSAEVQTQSREVLEDLMPALKGALDQPYANILMEDYTVFYVVRYTESLTSDHLLQHWGSEIARLIRGESKALSLAEQQNALEQRISYFEDDLVVMSWNASFIYDPEGSSEHVDMLEFANSELLELRSYDQMLDQQLAEIYDELASLHQKRWMVLFRNPFQSTIQKLLSLLIDVSELTDRIENSLKIIGDLYCARIYKRISHVLHLQEWQGRVDGKLNNARQIYDTLSAEVQDRRSTLLEVIIVLLILVEILLFLFPIAGH